ncbi:MAG: hypothetical protein ACK4FA_02700, partial [Candidatus Paceibacteria bacterium]
MQLHKCLINSLPWFFLYNDIMTSFKKKSNFLFLLLFLFLFTFPSLVSAGWVERTSSGQRQWYGVASSSDGTKLVAVVDNGYIYTSTDSGVTWTEQTGSGQRDWYDEISSSS